MTYSSIRREGVVVEEYVTGRILRITHNGKCFKFYAQSEGESKVAVYIGHGHLNLSIKQALRAWARDKGISIVSWGRDKELSTLCEIDTS